MSYMYRRSSRRAGTSKVVFTVVAGACLVFFQLNDRELDNGQSSQSEHSRSNPLILHGGGALNRGTARKVRVERSGRSFAPGAQLAGRITHVRDGDTIEVEGIPVRIANLDCAERGSTAGDRASQRMRDLVKTGAMTCRLEGRKSYDREVGTCRLSDGRDVGEVLIGEAVCERWRW